MLRWFLIAVGVLLLAGGIATLHVLGSFGWPAAAQLLFGGAFLLIVIFAEARRYGAKKNQDAGPWEATGERFTDPTTGKLMEVRYNPQTGQREYHEAG